MNQMTNIPATPAGLNSPARWGTESWIAETFGDQARDIAFVRKFFNFR
ncbi:MAG: hypothetical protein GY948_03725 [Alphaproteobacteria bacterium]|nr:hypothetical protein [Alphaproteobacteria bacterium]